MLAADTAVNRFIKTIPRLVNTAVHFHPQGSVECPDYCDDSFSCVIKGPTDVFVTESKCEVKALTSVRSSFKIVTNVLLD